MVSDEFQLLFARLSESNCAKKHTATGTYVNGVFRYAVNHCDFEGKVCPRLELPSGTGYELCKSHHSEVRLAERIEEEGTGSDGVAWLVGHYWSCEPCASSLKRVGVRELRIMEFPPER